MQKKSLPQVPIVCIPMSSRGLPLKKRVTYCVQMQGDSMFRLILRVSPKLSPLLKKNYPFSKKHIRVVLIMKTGEDCQFTI